jgi:hypothetical protein
MQSAIIVKQGCFACLSDPAVPGKALVRRARPLARPDVLNRVRDGDVSQVPLTLETKLAGNAHSKGSAVSSGKFLAIHEIRQQGLRVPRVKHVEAVKLLVQRKEDNVLRLREHSDEIQNVDKGHAGPLRNEFTSQRVT